MTNATDAMPRPPILAVVAHARSVPSVEREKFADRLAAMPVDSRRVVVRTCHRVELYAVADDDGLTEVRPPEGARRLEGIDAVHHLVRVACALDSTVFGETEILHQLRETVEERQGAQAPHPILARLFQVALRAGRESRAHFTGRPRSLADAAVDQIAPDCERDALSPLRAGAVLVVGVGRMGRLAALAAARRGLHVVVANRTASRASDLAAELEGSVAPFGLDETIGSIDDLQGVVVAIAGRWPVGPRTIDAFRSGQVKVIDLSSPPALDAETIERLGPCYVSIDSVAEPQAMASPRTVARLEGVVARASADFESWFRTRHAAPIISALSAFGEEQRRVEVERLRRRLPQLDDRPVPGRRQLTRCAPSARSAARRA
jgi:glutamyl-tRNA reductase